MLILILYPPFENSTTRIAIAVSPVYVDSTYSGLTAMAIWVMEFSSGGTKLELFLPENQHTQRKLLNLDNWNNGGLRSFKKS